MIVVTAASVTSSFLFFWDDFQELERREADRNRDRIRNGFFDLVEGLHQFNSNWAIWDQTYEFISNPLSDRRNYINTYLNKSTFWNANIDLVLFIDNNGKPVWARSFHSGSGELSAINPTILNYFIDYKPFSKSGKYGLFATETAAYLTSTRPILKSNGQGPRSGYLTMMRKIDSDFIQSFNVEFSTEINLNVYPKDIPNLTKLKQYEGWGQKLTSEKRSSYFHISSLDNKYTISIDVLSDRNITDKALLALTWNAIVVLISIALVFIVMMLGLDSIVIRPLIDLAKGILRIGQDDKDWKRLEDHRDDEIGLISHEVNRLQERIYELALNDHLTGLPNRRLFEDRINSAIERGKREGRQIALLFLDLNGFKQVNDTLGHLTGDELLVRVAKRLGSITRASDTLARLGGDEFGLIMEMSKTDDISAVETVCKKIADILNKPFMINDEKINISTSIGIALFPDHADGSQDIIRFADAAMYVAKANKSKPGKCWKFFEHYMITDLNADGNGRTD